MSAKPSSPAAAQKRVIKAEITTWKKAARKVVTDRQKEQSRIIREIRKTERLYTKITNACRREEKAILRRLGILEGRL